MINPELFLAFCITAAAVIIIPGPVVTLVVANALGHGRRAGLMTVFGALVGTAILIGFGAIGLTTVLTLMADIFEWVRWAGVAPKMTVTPPAPPIVSLSSANTFCADTDSSGNPSQQVAMFSMNVSGS